MSLRIPDSQPHCIGDGCNGVREYGYLFCTACVDRHNARKAPVARRIMGGPATVAADTRPIAHPAPLRAVSKDELDMLRRFPVRPPPESAVYSNAFVMRESDAEIEAGIRRLWEREREKLAGKPLALERPIAVMSPEEHERFRAEARAFASLVEELGPVDLTNAPPGLRELVGELEAEGVEVGTLTPPAGDEAGQGAEPSAPPPATTPEAPPRGA